jgi:outer membrane protein OmpA-like peptidoglycan-associated protein
MQKSMKHYFLLILLLMITTVTFSQEQFSIYFDSNKFELDTNEKELFNQWILENLNTKIVAINGYTDEDGSTKANDSLAQNRVDFVFNSVKSKVKIRDDFKTRSFGELHLHSKVKAENRKVTIFYLLEKDLVREEEILGIKKEIPMKIPKKEIIYPEKLVFENPNGTKSEFKLDRDFMKKVGESKVGEKLKIENLNFIINTFAVVNESRGKLYELLLVMQNNPNLKIEIQGHLCCMPVDRTNLSTQRAKAIYNFLKANKIDKTRLSYKGFGSTIPIYSLPEKSEMERAANRRVEIEIITN